MGRDEPPPRPERIEIHPSDHAYGPVEGIEPLREIVAEHYNRLYRAGRTSQYTAQNVAIATGGRLALSRCGAALGDVRFNDAQGRAVTLADKRGRVVLMNFWATWCLPCVREMPSLDRLQAKFDKSVFEVVLISEDRDPAVIEPFFNRLGLTAMAAYHDPRSSLSRQLAVIGLPTTLLIDQGGLEVGRVVGPAEWDSPEALALIRRYTVGSPLKAAAAE